jgi:serine/threonine protein kinase
MGAGTLSPGILWSSPEQIKGEPVPPASDVYQLAATLYAAIAGHHPFPGDHVGDVFARILAGAAPPPLPDVPAPLAAVIETGLATTLADRYPDVPAFAAALAAVVPPLDDAAGGARLAAWWASAPAGDRSETALFGDRCKLRWEDLASTERADVRHCASCRQPVIQVRSLAGVVPLAGKRCVSVAT